MKYKIGIAQMEVIPGAVEENEKKAERMVKALSEAGAQIIVLPELWNMGYALTKLPALAQNSKGRSWRLLRDLAKDNGVNLFGGSIGEKKENTYYNTAPVFNAQGEIVLKYRKAHLFPLGIEEDRFFSGGAEWGLGEINGSRFGLMICYDLRFPAFCRNLALRGAEMIFVPAQWPKARLDHWRALLIARAIENQVFMIAANRCGSDGDMEYPGHSMVVSPWGKIIAEGGDGEELLLVEINLDEIAQVRERIPVYRDRKNILDEIDESYL